MVTTEESGAAAADVVVPPPAPPTPPAPPPAPVPITKPAEAQSLGFIRSPGESDVAYLSRVNLRIGAVEPPPVAPMVKLDLGVTQLPETKAVDEQKIKQAQPGLPTKVTELTPEQLKEREAIIAERDAALAPISASIEEQKQILAQANEVLANLPPDIPGEPQSQASLDANNAVINAQNSLFNLQNQYQSMVQFYSAKLLTSVGYVFPFTGATPSQISQAAEQTAAFAKGGETAFNYAKTHNLIPNDAIYVPKSGEGVSYTTPDKLQQQINTLVTAGVLDTQKLKDLGTIGADTPAKLQTYVTQYNASQFQNTINTLVTAGVLDTNALRDIGNDPTKIQPYVDKYNTQQTQNTLNALVNAGILDTEKLKELGTLSPEAQRLKLQNYVTEANTAISAGTSTLNPNQATIASNVSRLQSIPNVGDVLAHAYAQAASTSQGSPEWKVWEDTWSNYQQANVENTINSIPNLSPEDKTYLRDLAKSNPDGFNATVANTIAGVNLRNLEEVKSQINTLNVSQATKDYLVSVATRQPSAFPAVIANVVGIQTQKQLATYPKELQDAYAAGGVEGLNQAIDAYNINVANKQTALKDLAPYKVIENGVERYSIADYLRDHVKDAPSWVASTKVLRDAGIAPSEIISTTKATFPQLTGVAGVVQKIENWQAQGEKEAKDYIQSLEKAPIPAKIAGTGVVGLGEFGVGMITGLPILIGKIIISPKDSPTLVWDTGKGIVKSIRDNLYTKWANGTYQAQLGKGDASQLVYDTANTFMVLEGGVKGVKGVLSTVTTWVSPRGIPAELIGKEVSTGRIPDIETTTLGLAKAMNEVERLAATKGGSFTGKIPIEGTDFELQYLKTPIQQKIGGILWHATKDEVDAQGNVVKPSLLTVAQEGKVVASEGGLYTDPWAAIGYSRGGTNPGLLMIIADPAEIKSGEVGLVRGLTQSDKFIRGASEGFYGSSKGWRGDFETEIVGAPGTKVIVPPPTADLATRITTGTSADFFTYDAGKFVPIKIGISKALLESGDYKAPTTADLYATKLLALRNSLRDTSLALQHPGMILKDVAGTLQSMVDIQSMLRESGGEKGGRIAGLGVRDIYVNKTGSEIVDIASDIYNKALSKTLSEGAERGTKEFADALERNQREIYDATARDILSQFGDVSKAYSTSGESRKQFEDAYTANLAISTEAMVKSDVISNAVSSSFYNAASSSLPSGLSIKPPESTQSVTSSPSFLTTSSIDKLYPISSLGRDVLSSVSPISVSEQPLSYLPESKISEGIKSKKTVPSELAVSELSVPSTITPTVPISSRISEPSAVDSLVISGAATDSTITPPPSFDYSPISLPPESIFSMREVPPPSLVTPPSTPPSYPISTPPIITPPSRIPPTRSPSTGEPPKGVKLFDDTKKIPYEGREITPGTVVWVQGTPKGGRMYRIIVPPYRQNDSFSSRSLPPGYKDEGWTGEGSAKASLQIIGGLPEKDIENIDLGWTRINIRVSSGKPEIEYVHDVDANVGARDKTVGQGKGQIPIQAWEEAKAKGVAYEDFVRSYTGELVDGYGKAEKTPTEQTVKTEPTPTETAIPETRNKQVYEELVALAESLGLKVEEVPYSQLKDYAAMNPDFAKTIGYDMPPDTIQLNSEFNTTYADKADNLWHELDEMGKIEKGDKYWKAHTDALHGEKKPSVETVTMPQPRPESPVHEKIEPPPQETVEQTQTEETITPEENVTVVNSYVRHKKEKNWWEQGTKAPDNKIVVARRYKSRSILPPMINL